MVSSLSATAGEQFMAGPQSLSVHKISDAARESVAKVVQQHKAKLPIPDYRFGFFPPHWWLGIIIRDPDLDKITFGEANRLATDLSKGISGVAAAGIKPGHPGAVLDNGHLTIGFAPPPEVFFEP
jgi:hypothetical protein